MRVDLLTFWAHVIEHSAWPVVVLVGVLSQHKAIAGLIKSIAEFKLKWGDKEASVGTRRIDHLSESVIEAAAAPKQNETRQVPPGHASEADASRDEHQLIAPATSAPFKLQARKRLMLSEAAHEAPAVVIERAWRDVRSAAYKLLGIDESAKTWWELDGLPDDQLIAELKADSRMDAKLFKAVLELEMIRNDAVTTLGWQPTPQDGQRYLESARWVVELIEAAAATKRAS